MLKNSKGIKVFSVVCYVLSLAALGFFIYTMVKSSWNFNQNIGFNIGLLVAAVMLSVVGIVLNPPKLFNSKNLNFVSGLVLYGLAGVALAFLIYNAVTGFTWDTALICSAIILCGLFFGTILLKIAKQDINVDARIKKEQQVLDEKRAEERAKLTACPYCGCRLKSEDEVCPNCKSKL